MQVLRGITWLLLLQSIGAIASLGLHLPLPGPVVGMLLLLYALRWPLVQQDVQSVAEFLLQHLSLLFVPVGVGVMTHLDILDMYGLRIAGVIVVSTWTGLAVTAWVLRALMRGEDRPDPQGTEGANSTGGKTAASSELPHG